MESSYLESPETLSAWAFLLHSEPGSWTPLEALHWDLPPGGFVQLPRYGGSAPGQWQLAGHFGTRWCWGWGDLWWGSLEEERRHPWYSQTPHSWWAHEGFHGSRNCTHVTVLLIVFLLCLFFPRKGVFSLSGLLGGQLFFIQFNKMLEEHKVTIIPTSTLTSETMAQLP